MASVYLAQLGRHVIICDADPYGANLHTVLGVNKPPLATPEQFAEGSVEPVQTDVPGLKLMPTAYDIWAVAPK